MKPKLIIVSLLWVIELTAGGIWISIRGQEGLVQCDPAGEALLARGDLEKAVDRLKAGLTESASEKNRDRQVICLRFLGLASKRRALAAPDKQQRLNNLADAANWYSELLKIEPEHIEALQALLSIYEEQGDSERVQNVRSKIQTLQGTGGGGGGGSRRGHWATLTAFFDCSGAPEAQCDMGDFVHHSQPNSQQAALPSCQAVDHATAECFRGTLVPLISLRAKLSGNQLAKSCQKLLLNPGPSWPGSGIFTSDGQLVFADPQANRIWSYVLPSLIPQEISHLKGLCSYDLAGPTWVKATEHGYIVQDRGTRNVSLLSEDDDTVWQVNLSKGTSSAAGYVKTLFNWALASGHLVGFGDIHPSFRSEKGALLDIPLVTPNTYRIIKEFDLADRQRQFYVGDFPYFASLKGRVFFLAMEATPTLYEICIGSADTSLSVIYKFPETYKLTGLPQISYVGVRNYYQAVEDATMPTGLYSSGRYLFIITRRPAGSLTDWELIKLDPDQNAILSRRPLPIHSKHLTVVPGDDFWGFLEKGEITGTSDHRMQWQIGGLLLVPKALVEGDGSLCPQFDSLTQFDISSAVEHQFPNESVTTHSHGTPAVDHE